MSSPNSPDFDPRTSPLRSVHTTNFPAILQQLGISLVVSTYQAGKVILVRPDGESLNTHFRLFNRPMGLAGDREKLAIGTAFQIIDLRNVPDTAARLDPPGKHDACYLPRNIHITGDIDIHEMAWAENELWFINTRFSCLCTLGHPNSFVPRWRPPFITAYDLTDRCHLNGLGLRDGKPKYVSALGETDTPAGWRQNKVNGGILMDIDTNQVLIRGLSMPHSPRWYGDRLWVLESGKGHLSTVDLQQQRLTAVAQLPGFTRGIDFWGNVAFIGLSQVRETAVFSGLEIAQHPERTCGVWVVNLQTGEIIAFLRFEEGVQEIFAISVLPNIRFPEIIEWDESLLASTYILPDEALVQTVKPSAENIEAEKHFAQGNELYNQGKLQEAAAEYRECLKFKPDFLRAKYNLGVVLGDLDQYAIAVEWLTQVIEVEPHHAEAHNSLGYVYSKQRLLEKAVEHYGAAVRLDGSYAKARFNLGMNLLQLGQFEQGWAESEWRWKTAEFTPLKCPQPRWQGEDISDKILLVHTEQGAGDAIQFVRYIPMAAQRCKKLVFVCTPALMKLFESVEGIDKIINAGTLGLDEFDVYLPLMSLPYIFNTTLETIPAEIPYLRVPKDHQFETLTLPQKKPKSFRVGITWAGSPTHKNDANRSCKLEDFLPILELASQMSQLEFYSLQKGDRIADLRHLPSEIKVHDLNEILDTYADTAIVMQQLDLVISVDTSVVHLAGALGRPVWTLLCYNPDWRWLVEGEETPWYPTMQLFRQPYPQDWQSVFQQVQQTLAEHLEIPLKSLPKTKTRKTKSKSSKKSKGFSTTNASIPTNLKEAKTTQPADHTDIQCHSYKSRNPENSATPTETSKSVTSQPSIPTITAKKPLGITWPIGIHSGWGTYGLNLTLELLQTDWEPLLLAAVANWDILLPTQQLRLKPLLQKQQQLQAALRQSGQQNLKFDFPVLCALGNQLGTSEEIAAISSPEKVGIIFFEDTYLTPTAMERAKHYRSIVVGSTWNQEVLQNQGIRNVAKVLQGIDPALFHPAPKSNLFGKSFIIFSGGKLEYRKGQDIIVGAFKAFHQRHSDALLLTAWHNHWPQFMAGLDQAGHVNGVPSVNSDGSLQVAQWLVNNGIPEDAVVALNAIPNHQMPQFLREADVALFTNRAEGGTNLVAMECFACGVPTILSANTGHLDLLGDHCYALQQQRTVEPNAIAAGTDGWGESCVEEVLEVLEHAYQNRSTAQAKGIAAAEFMQDWTWKLQVQRLLDLF